MIAPETPNLPAGFQWVLDLEPSSEMDALLRAAWPRYLIEVSDLDQGPPPSSILGKEELKRRFMMWGVRTQVNNTLCAFASGVMIQANLSAQTLPDTGWDFANKAALEAHTPNTFCMLSVTVDPAFRNEGLSQYLVEQGKTFAKQRGFSTLIVPVRPSKKSGFPLLKMEDYLKKRTDDGRVYDPWLRIHVKLGGQILNICHRSLVVRASLKKWSEWLGTSFNQSASIQIPGGLALLEIDCDHGTGTYVEPNIWVRYDV